jgi:hypothetical protein
MRDFGVIFERVPIMCDNTSAISVAKNSIFHERMRHLERRHHFLRDHVENGDIVIKYIDTKRQLTDIFMELLYASHFAALWGGLVFPILMAWFEGELVPFLIYILSYFHRFAFLHTQLS